jgi:hypothetical protein
MATVFTQQPLLSLAVTETDYEVIHQLFQLLPRPFLGDRHGYNAMYLASCVQLWWFQTAIVVLNGNILPHYDGSQGNKNPRRSPPHLQAGASFISSCDITPATTKSP